MSTRLLLSLLIVMSVVGAACGSDTQPSDAPTGAPAQGEDRSLQVGADGVVTWEPADARVQALTLRYQSVLPASEVVEPRSVGPAPESLEKHRHMVHLRGFAGDELVNTCAGVLVAPEWVLTVKHCWRRADSFTAVIGAADWTEAELDPDVFVFGSDMIVRQDFGVDLAMIRLDRPVPSQVGSPIPLHPATAFPDGTPAWIAGWGVQDNGTRPDRLRGFMTPIDADCGNWDDPETYTDFLEDGFDAERTLCTAAVPTGACTGDSGGPVVVDDGGVIFLIGIVAFGSGEGCGVDPLLPDGHVAVAAFADWVEDLGGQGWTDVALPVDATSLDLGELAAGRTYAVSLERRTSAGSTLAVATTLVP